MKCRGLLRVCLMSTSLLLFYCKTSIIQHWKTAFVRTILNSRFQDSGHIGMPMMCLKGNGFIQMVKISGPNINDQRLRKMLKKLLIWKPTNKKKGDMNHAISHQLCKIRNKCFHGQCTFCEVKQMNITHYYIYLPMLMLIYLNVYSAARRFQKIEQINIVAYDCFRYYSNNAPTNRRETPKKPLALC